MFMHALFRLSCFFFFWRFGIEPRIYYNLLFPASSRLRFDCLFFQEKLMQLLLIYVFIEFTKQLIRFCLYFLHLVGKDTTKNAMVSCTQKKKYKGFWWMTMSIEASNYQDIWIIRGFLNLQRNGWKSVPQFGGWEQNNHADPTSYTVVFTQARANRKQNKTDLTEFKRNSLGNEQELMAAQAHHDHHHHSDDSVTVRLLRSFLSDYQRYWHFLVQHEYAFLIHYI